VHPRELSNGIAAYDRLTTHMAQELVMNWKRDPS